MRLVSGLLLLGGAITGGDALAQALPAADLYTKLDLAREGLEKVRSAVAEKDLARAARELLVYYRARKTVKFPVDPEQRLSSRGQCASEKDLQVARDALKHIFISQRSWPPYDYGKDIDWYKNPYPDNEWIVQLHRQYWWIPMGKAYWHTGDEAFAKEWAFQFLDWKRKSPLNRWVGSSLNIGIRGHSLCFWYHYFRDSAAFTPELLVEFLATVYKHAELLVLPGYYSAGSNWGVMQSQGLAFIAMTFPEFKETPQWLETALSRFAKELDGQIYPDGLQRELTFHYHLGCIIDFSNVAELAELNGVPISKNYKHKIEQMWQVLAYSLKPDGTMPMFGDAWNDTVASLVGKDTSLYKRPNLEYIWSLSDKERRGTEPGQTSIAFTNSGCYIFRSDWTPDAVWMAVKCGPDGGWHCHPDNNTFELFAYGAYLMPDSGCYRYNGSDHWWFSTTVRHQCLTLNSQASAYAPQLLLWQTSPELTALTVQNQSYPGLAHRRNVFFIQRKVFLLVDELIGAGIGDRRLHFQFGPPEAALAADGSITVKGKDTGSLLFQPILDGFQAEKEPGAVTFKYNKKELRSAFAYGLNKKPLFAALLVPYKGEKPPAMSAALVANGQCQDYQPGDDRLRVRVTIGNEHYILQRDLKSKTVNLATDPTTPGGVKSG